MKLKMAERSPK